MTLDTYLSRNDLADLRSRDRTGVFAALHSFDDRIVTSGEFPLRTAELLAPSVVPGLAEAVAAGDSVAIGSAVLRAVGDLASESPTILAVKAVTDAADAVLAHRFTFYGETHQLPPDLDWDHNPGTAHWGHDLNRFSYLGLLAQAWCSTGDERYGRKIVELMLDWVRKSDLAKCFAGTPYMFGSYLNNAIHCHAWSVHIANLAQAGLLSADELMVLLKSLHDQLAYLRIVTAHHGGNWPTIGGQCMLGVLAALPVFRDLPVFADYCAALFNEQVADQVLPDGVQDELTPHYHWGVVRCITSAHCTLRKLGRNLAPVTIEVLRRMVHYTQQTIMPDRSKHLGFNDSDPGCVPDIRQLCDTADLADLVTPPEALGPECFPWAGVAFLRQRAADGDRYLAFDAGPFGRAHQHEDKLSFWLFAGGRNFIVDPGRHLYDWSEASFFPYLHQTCAHSSIVIDGQDQHSRGCPETWVSKAPIDLGWQAHEQEVRAHGSYTLGYGEDNSIRVHHQREIVFVRQRCWLVFDLIAGEGTHNVLATFQFAPGSNLAWDGSACFTGHPYSNLLLVPKASTPIGHVRIVEGLEHPRWGWYSDSYGKIEPAPLLAVRTDSCLPLRMCTLLYPYAEAEPPPVSLHLAGATATISVPDLGEVCITTTLT